MIAIVSPAKTLDFETRVNFDKSLPRFQKRAMELMEVLRKKSTNEVKKLMNISDNLAEINVERYQNFTKKKGPKHAKQAMFAFRGDVYQGLEADKFTEEDIRFAQGHFRMLSGLYGVLRPLDLIQPYRLEMGTRLEVNGSKNLYGFWGGTIAEMLNKDLEAQGDNILVNLASKEYFKAVNTDKLKGKVVEVEFKDFKSGKYKVIAFYAKKARGMMARYMIKNKLKTITGLKGFDYGGYAFDESGSTDNLLAFKRG